MGEDTTRLRQEIEQTREDLTRDVDLLTEKTSPSRIVERRVRRTKRGLAGIRDRVMGTVSEHTPGHGRHVGGGDQGGYGYQSGSGYRGGYGYSGEEYSQGLAGEYTGSAEYGAHPMGESTEQSGSTLTAVKDRATGAMSSAGEAVSSAGENLRGAAHGAKEHAEGNPLAAGLLAFGAGWLISSLLPASESEIRAARRATEQAKQHSGPVVEQVKQAAGEVGSQLKDSAQDAAQQVKEKAQDAAQTVQEEGKSSAAKVKEEATSQSSSAGGGPTDSTEWLGPTGGTAGATAGSTEWLSSAEGRPGNGGERL